MDRRAVNQMNFIKKFGVNKSHEFSLLDLNEISTDFNYMYNKLQMVRNEQFAVYEFQEFIQYLQDKDFSAAQMSSEGALREYKLVFELYDHLEHRKKESNVQRMEFNLNLNPRAGDSDLRISSSHKNEINLANGKNSDKREEIMKTSPTAKQSTEIPHTPASVTDKAANRVYHSNPGSVTDETNDRVFYSDPGPVKDTTTNRVIHSDPGSVTDETADRVYHSHHGSVTDETNDRAYHSDPGPVKDKTTNRVIHSDPGSVTDETTDRVYQSRPGSVKDKTTERVFHSDQRQETDKTTDRVTDNDLAAAPETGIYNKPSEETDRSRDLFRRSEEASLLLTQGNPNIVDLSDINRPTNLAERFSELYSNEYTDAFEFLQQQGQEEVAIVYDLLRIVRHAYKYCRQLASEELTKLIHNKLQERMAPNKTPIHEKEEIMIRGLAAKKLKVDAPALRNYVCDTFSLKEYWKLIPEGIDPTNEKLITFAWNCLDIVWLMCVQDPPISLLWVQEGDMFDTSLYRAYTKTGTIVDFCVWPVVLYVDSGPVLAKGIAQGKNNV